MFAMVAQSRAAFVGLALLVGLLVGSFLNVVIHRLPLMLNRQWRQQCTELDPAGVENTSPEPAFNLLTPGSHCPSCKASISAMQNIPLISWLALRGRCAECRSRISVRYPVIELLTGLMSAAVAWKFGYNWQAGAALLITWFLVALAGIDMDHQLLPDSLTLPLLWAGLIASLFWVPTELHPLPVSPENAIIGAAAGYLSLWTIFHLFRLATGKDGMGYGDFKLLAVFGAWLGWRMLLPIVLCSAAVGAVVGVMLILSGNRERSVPIPFGPFLASAGWLAIMWGPEWITRYLGLFGQA